MRIHTKLGYPTLYDAAAKARVTMEKSDLHGSRSHDRAFEIILSGSSNRYTNPGTSGRWPNIHAATWDEWGIFLGHLFLLDPAIKCWAYDGAEDFHLKTNWRFDYSEGGLAWEDQHSNHQWEYAAPMVNTCKTCPARRSWGPVAA